MKGATIYPYTTLVIILFQSTHPVKGATVVYAVCAVFAALFQSTHPVKGATDPFFLFRIVTTISIHAPCEGCDYSSSGISARYAEFQSTHPVKGATP